MHLLGNQKTGVNADLARTEETEATASDDALFALCLGAGNRYISRFGGSRAMVRQAMVRALSRKQERERRTSGCTQSERVWVAPGFIPTRQETTDPKALIRALDLLESTGMLDDVGYAAALIRSGRRKGASMRAISHKLAQKGICAADMGVAFDQEFACEYARIADENGTALSDHMENSIDQREVEDAIELRAAVRFLKQRDARIGKRADHMPRQTQHDRAMQNHLAALVRRGFSLAVAKKAFALFKGDSETEWPDSFYDDTG